MTLEIEPTIFGNLIKDEKLLTYQQGGIDAYYNKITDMLAGLLCTEHVHLPELERKYVDGRWIIEVNSCCENQIEMITKRLDEKYKG